MKPHILVRACCLAGLLHVAMASPASATTAPHLRAALDAAWQRSLSLPHTEGLRLRAQAEHHIATRLWAAAPSLEVSQRSDRWQRNHGSRETELSLGVPLWQRGQRAAQQAAASGLNELAEAEQAAARLQLAGQVREQAWALRHLQASARLAEVQAQALTQLAADVGRRVQAGDLADTDHLAAQAEALAAATQAHQAQQAHLQARHQWRLLTGLETEPTPEEPLSEAQALGEAHPLLRLAQARLAQARQQLELSRRSGFEAPELRLGWRQEQAARGAEREGSLQLGLRIPLAPERRNAAELAEATLSVRLAETELQRQREQIEVEHQTARAALRSAQAQATNSAEQARLLRQRASLLQRAFQAGETALPELLRALAGAAQAEAGLQQAHASLGLAQARLQQSQGLLP